MEVPVKVEIPGPTVTETEYVEVTPATCIEYVRVSTEASNFSVESGDLGAEAFNALLHGEFSLAITKAKASDRAMKAYNRLVPKANRLAEACVSASGDEVVAL